MDHINTHQHHGRVLEVIVKKPENCIIYECTLCGFHYTQESVKLFSSCPLSDHDIDIAAEWWQTWTIKEAREAVQRDKWAAIIRKARAKKKIPGFKSPGKVGRPPTKKNQKPGTQKKDGKNRDKKWGGGF